MAVIATAGHVDHGKSTLVRLLTGQEPDRWAEERRRGLTIDLGYAWTDIDGRRVSLVDVPGHEHFTGNMLAGLAPVAAVMFVVAADDGWRPQSGEHALAIAALGIEHLLLVVTRCDLAPGGPAASEGAQHLRSLGVPVAETVLVSGATGDGVPALRAALGRLAAAAHPMDPTSEVADRVGPRTATSQPQQTPVRLWVDRAFTIRGAGTVVTGTLSLGRIEVGSELLLDGAPVRVRGLQTCGEDVGAVVGPVRVAVNLRGVEVAQVARGAVLVQPHWPGPPASVVDVDLRPLHDAMSGGEGAVPQRLPRELTLHGGTAAMPVRTQLLADGRVRLRLAAPLPLVAGDRAVLRDPGRHQVLAGVDIRVVDPPRRRRRPRAGPGPAASAAHPPAGAPAPAAARAQNLVAWLGQHPMQAPSRAQLDAWALTARDLADAADRGEILRLGGVVVVGDAIARAEAAVRSVRQPFSVGEAARAMGTSRRVAVPLLERLDAALVTRRLADGGRELRDAAGPGGLG